MKPSLLCLVIGGSLLCFGPSHVRADFINFGGLTGAEAPLPSGYAGFTWNNFSSLNTQTDVNVMPSGYQYANTDAASPNVAFNLFGSPASMSRATLFSFYGGSFTAAWRDNLVLDVQGYRNGSLLYDQTFTLNSTQPTLINVNFHGIDTLTFTSSGGTVHGWVPLKPASHPPLTQFAMDDLSVASGDVSSTPEPSSLVLLLSGSLAAGVFAARHLRPTARTIIRATPLST